LADPAKLPYGRVGQCKSTALKAATRWLNSSPDLHFIKRGVDMECPNCGCDRVKSIKTNVINGVFSASVVCKNCDTPFVLSMKQYAEMLKLASKRLTTQDLKRVCDAIIDSNKTI